MKWLNSLDELLYEVMSWLLFFPLTLWRVAVRPLATMQEITRQAALPDDQQYAAVLSPPLFLALSLLFAHAVATALGHTDAIIANRHGLAALVTDETSALILRMIVFASFALFLAARTVRLLGRPLDRATLRLPFYAQCYPTALCATALSLGVSIATSTLPHAGVIGGALAAISLLNYVVVEVRWFAALGGRGLLRASANVVRGLSEGLVFLLCVGFLFTR